MKLAGMASAYGPRTLQRAEGFVFRFIPAVLAGLLACCGLGGCRRQRVVTETGVPITTVNPQVWALTPDGNRLVVGDLAGDVEIFDAASGQLKALVPPQGPNIVPGAGDMVSSLAFDPNGRNAILGYNDGFVLLVDLKTGTVLRRAKAHVSHVSRLAVAANGRYLVSSSDSSGPDKLKLWSMEDGHLVWSIPFAAADVSALAISPDGKEVAFCDHNGLLEVAHPETRTVSVLRKPNLKDFGYYSSLAFAPDGKTFASGGFHGDVQLWSAATDTVQSTWKSAAKRWLEVSDLAFSSDGRSLAVAASGGSNTVQIRSVKDGTVLSQMAAGQGRGKLIFTPAHEVKIAGNGSTSPLRIWDMPAP